MHYGMILNLLPWCHINSYTPLAWFNCAWITVVFFWLHHCQKRQKLGRVLGTRPHRAYVWVRHFSIVKMIFQSQDLVYFYITSCGTHTHNTLTATRVFFILTQLHELDCHEGKAIQQTRDKGENKTPEKEPSCRPENTQPVVLLDPLP